jgi:hypothetical protein
MADETYQGITYVIPCGGAKLDRPAPAAELYTGSMFRHTLAKATRRAELDQVEGVGPARVLILSARYGLVELGQVLEPYDLKMTDKGSVTAQDLTEQARRLGMEWGSQVYGLLPRAYLARLDTALKALDVYVQDVYEGCAGLLQQKVVNVLVGTPWAPAEPQGTQPEGLRMWIGGDVSSLWWGVPVLVSYGRLREAANFPRASAPWVLDSRGFSEIDQHGTWTVTAEQYAADVRRYCEQIGRPDWVAPQDWPAAAATLARTGLDESEHQRRTIASVVQLRTLLPDLPVLAVLTGTDAAGYLRHVEMYRQAGIDVTAELVAVGALVARAPEETADIVRLLHAAGVTRMHGLGVKGRALDLIGPLLESTDSAGWSDEARRRHGACGHQAGAHGRVQWERNCPQYARQWASGQVARANSAHVQPYLFA